MKDLATLFKQFLIKITFLVSRFRSREEKILSPNFKVGNFLSKSIRFMKFVVIPKLKSLLPFKYNEEQKILYSLSEKRIPSIRQLKQFKYFLDYKEKRIKKTEIISFKVFNKRNYLLRLPLI